MKEMEEPRFDAPTPGMSLTHEVGARPWQTPPKLTTVDEVVQDYMTKMRSDSFVQQLIGVLESGVPVTTLANTIQLAGVMEGRHTIDTGMLVIPVLMEMMMLIADKAGIKYNTGMESDIKEESRDSNVAAVLEEFEQELENKKEQEAEMIDEEDIVEEEIEEGPMGLMSRRAS